MKKLMFAAAACALAGVAQATWINQGVPAVYDYKASVKHMYLKSVKVADKYWDTAVKARVLAQGGDLSVYQKYQKSASLKGYLIMDNVGATSQTIIKDAGVTPANPNTVPGTCADFGRNRGFLVVQNSSAEADVRFPKILPAVLDAKWIDTAFTKEHIATSGIAEGTLFVGGDTIKAVRSIFDELTAGVTDRGAAPTDMYAYADYNWTSVYLFGKYNGPNMFDALAGAGPFDVFETAWDGALPTALQIGFAYYQPFYHDTWMNGAGIGKWQKGYTKTKQKLCCGLMQAKATNWSAPELVSLSGNLKGGVFLCTDNGIACWDPQYSFFDAFNGGRSGWDDQFVTQRLVASLTDTFLFAGDKWQNDMWQDGAIEQETTDVVYGTWSIKLNTKFFDAKGPFEKYGFLTATEILCMNPAATTFVESAKGVQDLCGTIKAAALTLNKNAWVFGDTNIPLMFKNVPESEKSVPVVDPAFATYYGLANWD